MFAATQYHLRLWLRHKTRRKSDRAGCIKVTISATYIESIFRESTYIYGLPLFATVHRFSIHFVAPVRSYIASKSFRLFVRRNKRIISLENSQRRRFHLVTRKLFAVLHEKGYRRYGTVEQQLQRRDPLARNNFHFVRLFANCSRYTATVRAR